jgi:hypothetical protein
LTPCKTGDIDLSWWSTKSKYSAEALQGQGQGVQTNARGEPVTKNGPFKVSSYRITPATKTIRVTVGTGGGMKAYELKWDLRYGNRKFSIYLPTFEAAMGLLRQSHVQEFS